MTPKEKYRVKLKRLVKHKNLKKWLTISRYGDKITMKGESIMPVLSRFYGIIIRMYFLQREHNPPHIHAIYGENMAAVNILDGTVLEDEIPGKALDIVREWISLHKKELLAMWDSQTFRHLPPL